MDVDSGGCSARETAVGVNVGHLTCQPSNVLASDWLDAAIRKMCEHELEHNCECKYCTDVVLGDSMLSVAVNEKEGRNDYIEYQPLGLKLESMRGKCLCKDFDIKKERMSERIHAVCCRIRHYHACGLVEGPVWHGAILDNPAHH